MLHVGQKVVCVDIRPIERALRPGYAGTIIPTLGGVYTIRDIFDAGIYGYDEPGLLLCEIVNPVRKYTSPAGRPVTCEALRAPRGILTAALHSCRHACCSVAALCRTSVRALPTYVEPYPALRK